MAGPMRTSQKGIDLIMRFEGFWARSAPLPDGGHIIGFGHTRHAKPKQSITRDDARTLLVAHDLRPIEREITANCLAPLTQNEFDGLVAFAFNIGLENFLDSDVWGLVNSGDKLAAAEAMAAWRKARINGRIIVVDALVRRRAAERALFLDVEGGPTPAPTPIVRAQLDLARAILTPRETAYDVTTDDPSGSGDESVIQAEIVGEPEPLSQERSDSRPEVAARAVAERLSRILGEDTPQTDDAPTPETSIDAITEAVSKLADEAEADEDAPTQEQIRPRNSNAPKSSDSDEVYLEPARMSAQKANLPLVNDLEEVDLNGVHPEPELSRMPHTPTGSLVLYGAAAFGGALTGAWGIRHLTQTMSSESVLRSDWDLYAGPFAMLVGGLIFLIMTYYLMRALFANAT